MPTWPVEGGEMGWRMRAHDWSASSIGASKLWSQAQRTSIDVMLGTEQAMCLVWGPDRVLFYNDAYIPLLGLRHPDALGRPIAEVWAEIWSEIEPLVERALSGESVRFEDMPLLMTRNGYPEETWWSFTYSPLRDETGAVAGMLNVTTDSTGKVLALRQADEERERLRESEVRLRDFADTLAAQVAARTGERDRMWMLSEDMLARADLSGMMTAVSPAWTRVLGWSEEELLKRPYASFMHSEDEGPTLAGLALMGETGRPTRFENRISTIDGGWKSIEWTVAPEEDGFNFIAVGRDLSIAKAYAAELAAVQEALRQSQKMEAVGQLTGGLAHDFNNLLAGISGSLDMIEKRVRQGRVDDLERYVTGAQGSAKRAAALTHRLLAFSRRQTLAPKPTDVGRLVVGMEELVQRTVGPQIDVETKGTDVLWLALVDPNQLENALLNLCINARDAMPDGGRITIETGRRRLDERAAKERDLPPGDYVFLAVSDVGTGMSADVAERAFDPFFTTKPIGVGTGLGLSMIYGFVRQSGGQVRIQSEVGAGTTVSLYLPWHHGEAAGEAHVPPEPIRAETDSKTVLVVDDEPLVRMLMVDAVEDLGYVAIEAGDGPEAIQILRSDATIDLLVTDVGLPNGMNGRQVADAARELRSNLKVLFVTGYAENAVLSGGHLETGMQVVTKPFDMTALTNRIQGMVGD